MKLWQKIFLSTLALMVLCTASVSVLLLKNDADAMWQREADRAAAQTRYLAGILKSGVINARLQMGRVQLDEQTARSAAGQVIRNQVPDSYLVGMKLFAEDGTAAADTIGTQISLPFPETGDGGETYCMLSEEQGRWYYLVSMPLMLESSSYVLQAAYDVTDLAVQMEEQSVQTVLRSLDVSTGAAVLLLVLIRLLLRRLQALDESARRIAGGQYDRRVPENGSDELADLAKDMNQLAEAVQKRVGQLEQVAEDRRIFIANLAHEMKTPLTGILGYADLLYLSAGLSEEKRVEYASVISEEAKRMRALSSRLLELTVLGETAIERKPVRLAETAGEVRLSLSPLLQQNGMELQLSCENVSVMADEALFKSLLYNLLDNARKASSRGSVIEMSVRREGKDAVIRIRDHGCGMAEEELEKIFRPFYMVDKSRSRKAGGAGLGLALCERIILLHQGTIRMESAPGEGTTAELRFPAVQEDMHEQ